MPKSKRARTQQLTGRYSEREQVIVPRLPPAAFVRGYEAQIVLDPDNPNLGHSPKLICWTGSDDNDDDSEGDKEIWADRYDAMHLVASVPIWSARSVSPSSTWSVASDADELFNLSGNEELETHARERRRAWIESLRDARVQERKFEEENAAIARDRAATLERVNKERTRLENEVPPDDIIELMAHTARSLALSPNAPLLEMRILARHASDTRFAFLRPCGPWSKVWERARADAGANAAERLKGGKGDERGAVGGEGHYQSQTKATAKVKQQQGGLRLVGGYNSDTGSDSDDGHSQSRSRPPSPSTTPPPLPSTLPS